MHNTTPPGNRPLVYDMFYSRSSCYVHKRSITRHPFLSLTVTGQSRSQNTTKQDRVSPIKYRNTSLPVFRDFILSALPYHVLNLSFCHTDIMYYWAFLSSHRADYEKIERPNNTWYRYYWAFLSSHRADYFFSVAFMSPPDNLRNTFSISVWHSSLNETIHS